MKQLERPMIDELKTHIRGDVFLPGDAGYDEARAVYNAMIDKRPALVVRVADAGDVMACVNAARDAGVDLAIRGGGHSGPGFGTCDDGIVIDFSACRGIRVDPQRQTARVEAGCTWGDFNHATHAFGLTTTGGIISTTGVAGLTLGGGIGYLTRRCGLSCDNLISADVVLADGTFVTANEKQNQDLFWALRGAGGNFGVVTSLEFKLHPIAQVYGGPIIYPAEHCETVATFYNEFMADAPDDFGAFFGVHQGPPVPFLPEEWHAKPVVVVVGMWSGSPDEGESRWKPFFDVAPVAGSYVGPMPYPALNVAFDPLLPPGQSNYWKSSFMKTITDGFISSCKKFGQHVPTPGSGMHCYPIDGAANRVGTDETAFPYRNVRYSPIVLGFWDDPQKNADNIAWVRSYWGSFQGDCEPGGYINFMDADDSGRLENNYRGIYRKLASVKKKYDPKNIFHVNQNIKPA